MHDAQGGRIALGPHRAAVGIGRPRLARRHLLHQHLHRQQDVNRLEARRHHRDAIVVGQEVPRPQADDGGDMPRPDDAIQPHFARVEDGAHGRGRVFVHGVNREVGDAAGAGHLHGRGHARRGGLEAHAQEHHLTFGMALGQDHRVQWGVHDPYVSARGRGFLQRLRRARHPHHVTEGGQGDVGQSS